MDKLFLQFVVTLTASSAIALAILLWMIGELTPAVVYACTVVVACVAAKHYAGAAASAKEISVSSPEAE